MGIYIFEGSGGIDTFSVLNNAFKKIYAYFSSMLVENNLYNNFCCNVMILYI